MEARQSFQTCPKESEIWHKSPPFPFPPLSFHYWLKRPVSVAFSATQTTSTSAAGDSGLYFPASLATTNRRASGSALGFGSGAYNLDSRECEVCSRAPWKLQWGDCSWCWPRWGLWHQRPEPALPIGPAVLSLLWRPWYLQGLWYPCCLQPWVCHPPALLLGANKFSLCFNYPELLWFLAAKTLWLAHTH